MTRKTGSGPEHPGPRSGEKISVIGSLWSILAEGVTHLRLEIKPDKGGRVGRATLTSLALA